MTSSDNSAGEHSQRATETPVDEGARPQRRILYVQYANPAAYPPLEHSSRILANKGWLVFLFGAAALGTEPLRSPIHPRIESHLWNYKPPGWKQKLHYFAFSLTAIFMVFRTRARWIYVSDPLACPVGWALSLLGYRVIYHEHDSPNIGDAERSWFMRFILGMRLKLAGRAAFCVLPNEQRVRRFESTTGTLRPVLSVMNCPCREEAEIGRAINNSGGQFIVFYHGSIVPARLPISVVQAVSRMPGHVILRIAGYETPGHSGYVDMLKAEAVRLGMGARIEYLGPVPHRADLLAECRRADVGISLMPLDSTDLNEQTMAGASNKAFDYMACGVPMLVSDLPEWREMFVLPGFGLACDPAKSDSIAKILGWFVEHSGETRDMGNRGRERIRGQWNYEEQFEAVLKRL